MQLFKRVGKNRFKLITESEWATVQEHNKKINAARREIKSRKAYIEAAKKSPYASSEVKSYSDEFLKSMDEFDKIFSAGYLDSGYQYDDKDPRNQSDIAGDTFWDNEKARTGSSKSDEVESEIRQEVALRKFNDERKVQGDYFTAELADELWPTDDDWQKTFAGEKCGISEYISEISYLDSQSEFDSEEY